MSAIEEGRANKRVGITRECPNDTGFGLFSAAPGLGMPAPDAVQCPHPQVIKRNFLNKK
ncbi:MAG: hypothetical protein ACREB3_07840 [Burkholderiales bacterium]